jgi:hypothetical protein
MADASSKVPMQHCASFVAIAASDVISFKPPASRPAQGTFYDNA